MQSNVFPLWILLPLAIFPLLGLVFIVIGIRRGVRAIRILRNGAMTRGRLVDKQRTSTRVNNQRVYRLVFEYEDGLGRKYTTDAKTHETHRLQDEAEERLVYDRHAPGRAILVDNLPGAPRLDVDRGVYEASVPKAVALLVLPVLGTGMAVAFVFMAWVAIT